MASHMGVISADNQGLDEDKDNEAQATAYPRSPGVIAASFCAGGGRQGLHSSDGRAKSPQKGGPSSPKGPKAGALVPVAPPPALLKAHHAALTAAAGTNSRMNSPLKPHGSKSAKGGGEGLELGTQKTVKTVHHAADAAEGREGGGGVGGGGGGSRSVSRPQSGRDKISQVRPESWHHPYTFYQPSSPMLDSSS